MCPPTPKASACESIPILPTRNLLIQPTLQYKQTSKKQQSKKPRRPNTFNRPGRLMRSQYRLAHKHAKTIRRLYLRISNQSFRFPCLSLIGGLGESCSVYYPYSHSARRPLPQTMKNINVCSTSLLIFNILTLGTSPIVMEIFTFCYTSPVIFNILLFL